MTDKTFWRKSTLAGFPVMVPADPRTAEIMRGYRQGETRGGKLTCPRNVGFHRLMHRIGKLAANNLDSFHDMDAHDALKRLQLESGVECDEVAVRIDGEDMIYKIPRSLSFDSMDDDTFKKVSRAMCQHLVDEYEFGSDVEEIHRMAQEHERSAA